jgi:hypothetical protein
MLHKSKWSLVETLFFSVKEVHIFRDWDIGQKT